MNKTKKRIIASLSAAGIIVLSVAFGRGEQSLVQENTSIENTSINSINAILNNGRGSGKHVITEGDSNNVIQKISVNGTIDEKMTDEEQTYSILNQINLAAEDNNVKAILLSVNSPGGGVYESAEIYNALLNSGKDVYVSMKQTAASGGYYISMASKKIYANEETTTGSLGVIMSNLSMQKFLEDHGIKNQVIRSGANKAVGGLAEDLTDDAKKIYEEILKDSYNKFVDVIAKGRNMDREKVLELADGRIYSGTQAVKNGLIDKIGSEKDLIEDIKQEKGISNPKIIEYRNVENDNPFIGRFIKSISRSVATELKSIDSTTVERNYLG
ncbi:signal peptide peptidase SppA [Gemelliphila palaticanis]|uniref:Signal peptide peptidase SppA n=1 Tax=Gemelliphila palaticanis TaxID=81950 RepID=A0ABX2SXR0_9BACL|nr:signal peptide peptidase SppA [Gemella palaticanis]MBF0714798.1 signal peptide peptidase SppA [Gemella palaticanis]NYS46728.1 signal peptide peptidase SppA [Gemella palaticanis]